MNVKIKRTELIRLVEARILADRERQEEENRQKVLDYIAELAEVERQVKAARTAALRKTKPEFRRVHAVYPPDLSQGDRLEYVVRMLKSESREYLSLTPDNFANWT